MKKIIMKICSKCGEFKKLAAFSKCKKVKNGLSAECKDCHNQNYQDNKEKIKIQQKQYRQDNKEKIAMRKSQYQQANKEKIAAQHKQYRQDNKESYRIRNKQYYQNNKESLRISQKKYCKNNKEKIAMNKKQFFQYSKETLTDRYIAQILKMKSSEISPELIEIKRIQLKILRYINNNYH